MAMQFASAVTTKTDLDEATQALVSEIRAQISAPSLDFAIVFLSPHFGRAAIFVADQLREALHPRVLIGCTSEGVIGREHEIENQAAISLVAAQMPKVEIHPFAFEPNRFGNALNDSVEFKNLVGAPSDTKLFILIGDPFSMPMDDVLNAFNAFYPGLPIIGGMASGAQHSNGNSLVLTDRVIHAGAVGVAMAGEFGVDTIVSQGCRPIGPMLRATHTHDNIIVQLEEQSPLAKVREVAEGLPEADRELLQNGLFVGRAIAASKEALGRGDFLIRGVMGFDAQSGAMAVGDNIRDGETIQFHLRDQNTATEDLELLLMPQVFDTTPSGALVFSCNGRGTRLYDHPDGDVATIQKILGGVNLAGFFCAGEIGPIGGKNFLHGHTASIVLFRPAG